MQYIKRHLTALALVSVTLLVACGQSYEEPQASISASSDWITETSLEKTMVTPSGVAVTFNDFKTTLSDSETPSSPAELKPQQVLVTLTYTSSSVPWNGTEKYISSLTNKSKFAIALSTSVSDSATGSITGGFDYQAISAQVGFTGTYSTTTTVTTNPVTPGGTVLIYSRPGGTKAFGYQRLGPAGVSWAWCNANPTNCTPLNPWTAIKVTGIGFVAR
jgi:hypothetical protein